MHNTDTEQIFVFIKKYIDEIGYSPSLREIASGVYLSVSSVLRHLDKLEAWGWITRDPNKARSIIVLHKAMVDGLSTN
jgi:repressor LexA